MGAELINNVSSTNEILKIQSFYFVLWYGKNVITSEMQSHTECWQEAVKFKQILDGELGIE